MTQNKHLVPYKPLIYILKNKMSKWNNIYLILKFHLEVLMKIVFHLKNIKNNFNLNNNNNLL